MLIASRYFEASLAMLSATIACCVLSVKPASAVGSVSRTATVIGDVTACVATIGVGQADAATAVAMLAESV